MGSLMGNKKPITVITGPTASGKTALACNVAYQQGGEIIGADSRQVYQFMDIGTGKDLDEFTVNGVSIPYHLIDYVHPSEKYHIQTYKTDFLNTWNTLETENKKAILCGGTGMYIQGVCHADVFTQIPINEKRRETLIELDKLELQTKLKSFSLTYPVDFQSKKRLIRGIEIHEFLQNNPIPENPFPEFNPLYFICFSDVEIRKEKITKRLKYRLNHGMIEEVEALLSMGITHDRLQFFGLEYKFISKYLLNELDKETLFLRLNTAIHQYAKRQMTWMRRIGRQHEHVHFLDVTEKKSDTYSDFVLQTQEKHERNFK